jgi:hypothetical protein
MRSPDLQIPILVTAAIAAPLALDTLFLDLFHHGGQARSGSLAAVAQVAAFQTARAASMGPVTIPQGTLLRVRTTEFIDVDSTQSGTIFRGALDDPIMINGNVIVPRGADVELVAARVEQGGKFKGSDLVQLKINSIFVHGHPHMVMTSYSEHKSEGEGKKTARRIGGGAGLGAIIGGIAGGGTGAGIGALVGGGAGTVWSASGQPHLKIPSETRLDFQLLSDWKIN